MVSFLVRRLIQSLAVLGVMSFVIYAMMGLMPGDPVDLMISGDPRLTPEDAERLKALFGLDMPLPERYLNWASAALQGNFGYSRLFARPVGEVLGPALSNTAKLMGLAFALSLAIGLSAGIWAAVRPYSGRDYLINFFAFAGISMPSFWLGLMLIIAFAVMLGILPAGGIETVGASSFLDRARHLVLPVVTLVIASVGGHTRYMRASMIETLRADFVRTAYAKGASRRRVVLGHALGNALIPVVTIIGLEFGFLFSGALITETIFSYPGMGKLIFDSIMGNDFNLALTALMLATLITLVGNLAADVAYAALDPRITLE